jgi:hypothetical protein
MGADWFLWGRLHLGYRTLAQVHPMHGQSPLPIFIVLFANRGQRSLVTIENSVDSWGQWPQLELYHRIFEALSAMRQAISGPSLRLADFVFRLNLWEYPQHHLRLSFCYAPPHVEPNVVPGAKENHECLTGDVRVRSRDACDDRG